MPGGIERRSPRTRFALVSRVFALGILGAALLLEHQQLRWILFALAAGLALAPFAWRRKAAIAPGAFFASSADLIPGGSRRPQFSGELSLTATGLTWTPSRHAISEGCRPLSIAISDCAAVTLQRGSALLDVIISVRREDGSTTDFLTHWSPGLGRALAQLTTLWRRLLRETSHLSERGLGRDASGVPR